MVEVLGGSGEEKFGLQVVIVKRHREDMSYVHSEMNKHTKHTKMGGLRIRFQGGYGK
jgi:hypothetical protein